MSERELQREFERLKNIFRIESEKQRRRIHIFNKRKCELLTTRRQMLQLINKELFFVNKNIKKAMDIKDANETLLKDLCTPSDDEN